MSFKSTTSLIIAAILLAFFGAKAAKRKSKQKRLEYTAQELGYDGLLKDAEKKREAANKHKVAAAAASYKAEKQLEKLGEQSPDIDAAMDRFSSVYNNSK